MLATVYVLPPPFYDLSLVFLSQVWKVLTSLGYGILFLGDVLSDQQGTRTFDVAIGLSLYLTREFEAS